MSDLSKDTVEHAMILSFCARRILSSKTQKISNTGLRAGSPLHFYCKYCETQTEVLDDGYLFKPETACSQCKEIEKAGLTDKAEEAFQKAQSQKYK